MKKSALGFCCLTLLWSGRLLGTEVIELTAAADTSLLESFPTHNFGGQTYFNAGTTQNYTKNRALLKFDLATGLPFGAKIVSASLTVDVVHTPVDGDNPTTFEMRRILRDWGEGNKEGYPPTLGDEATLNDSNWYYRFAETTNLWGVPGGLEGVDYVSVSSGEQFIYGILFSPYTFDSTPRMISDLQSWLDQPTNNFGWMLLTQDEDINFSARRFASRESGYGPTLRIEFFVPAIDRITILNNKVQIGFAQEANQPYTIEYHDVLTQAGWSVLTNLPPTSEWKACVIEDTVQSSARFYRLKVP